MTCGSCRRDLSALIDGELAPRREAALHRHLRGCAACTERLAQLARVAEATAGLPAPVPPDLDEGILAAIERDARTAVTPGRSRALGHPALAWGGAAMILLFVGLGVLVVRDRLLESLTAAHVVRDGPAAPDATSLADAKKELQAGAEKEAGASPVAEGDLEGANVPAPPPVETEERLRGLGYVGTERDAFAEAPTSEEPSRDAGQGSKPAPRAEAKSVPAAPRVSEARQDDAEQATAATALEPEDAGKRRQKKSLDEGLSLGRGIVSCTGPAVAEPGPGQILGCLAPAGEVAARIRVGEEAAPPADLAQESSRTVPRAGADGDAPPGFRPSARPLPVPAWAARRTGHAVLRVTLDADGTVVDVHPLDEGNADARDLALAVAAWRFEGPVTPAPTTLLLAVRIEPAVP